MSQIKDDDLAKTEKGLSVSSRKILEEDEYLGRMASIIKRDFFSNPDATPSIDCDGFTEATDRTDTTTSSSVKSRKQACSLSLNKFLEKYTSEDNAYFEKLQRKDLKRHRARFPWLYEGKQKKTSNTPILVSSSAVLSIEGPKKESAQPQSTINYHSNRCLDHLFKEPAPVSNPGKIRTLGCFKDKFGIDGRPLGESETPLEEATTFFISETPKPAISDQRIKIETNKFYIPNESPRDQLAHRLYQEKVAKNVRTPKTNSHRDTSSRRTDKLLFNN